MRAVIARKGRDADGTGWYEIVAAGSPWDRRFSANEAGWKDFAGKDAGIKAMMAQDPSLEAVVVGDNGDMFRSSDKVTPHENDARRATRLAEERRDADEALLKTRLDEIQARIAGGVKTLEDQKIIDLLALGTLGARAEAIRLVKG